MKAFVITMVVMQALAILATLYRLADNQYPRTKTETPADAVGTMVITALIFAWGLSIVWGE